MTSEKPHSAAASEIRILIAPEPAVGFEANLSAVAEAAGLPPFSAAAEAFIADVSRTILRSPAMRQFPELMAMAHALRPAQIAALKSAFESSNRDRIRRAVGMAFHIAPSNVDSIFVYSWFLALLGGNANLIRLSSRLGEQVDRLIAVLGEVVGKPNHEDVRRRTLVVGYERDDAVTAEISKRCAIRVLWGGDATIEHVRALPLNPHAREIAFADRFSLALFDTATVLNASDSDLRKLIDAFFNDAFWFDQNACSSPRQIVWLGEPETVAQAQERFWTALGSKLAETGWQLEPAAMMARMTAVQSFAARNETPPVSGDWAARGIVRIALPRLTEDARRSHPGGGVFYETVVPTLEALDDMLGPRDQTLCVYGVARDTLRKWLKNRTGAGIDRVVPVGHALDFSSVWDGQDLMDVFTREVALEQEL